MKKSEFCGILLAGGTGSRLFPLTSNFSKHFLPIYNKPMFYYSLSVLMLANIRRILVISTAADIQLYRSHFEENLNFGLDVHFAVQESASGIPDAFKIGDEFVGLDNVILMLGDNIFYGAGFATSVIDSVRRNIGATVYGAKVSDPSRYGVVCYEGGAPQSIIEKPREPCSDIAIPGLYVFDNSAVEKCYTLTASKRGELEITDLLNLYLVDEALSVELLGRGTTWFDTGTVADLKRANDFVEIIETKQGVLVGSPHEIAVKNGWLDVEAVLDLCAGKAQGQYYSKLQEILTS